MKPIVNLLWQQGVLCIIYLDNLQLLNSSPREAWEVTQMVLNLFEYLGLMAKPSKVEVVHTKFLGMMIDTVQNSNSNSQDLGGSPTRSTLLE